MNIDYNSFESILLTVRSVQCIPRAFEPPELQVMRRNAYILFCPLLAVIYRLVFVVQLTHYMFADDHKYMIVAGNTEHPLAAMHWCRFSFVNCPFMFGLPM